MTNQQIVQELLKDLPSEFYGSVELSFHKGRIMQSKTVTSRKFNPEQNSAGSQNVQSKSY